VVHLEREVRSPDLGEAIDHLVPSAQAPLFGVSPSDPRLLAVCGSCAYRPDGCDFRDPDVPRSECSPCGGLRAVAGLLAAGLDLDL
jgi:hypothetical protein